MSLQYRMKHYRIERKGYASLCGRGMCLCLILCCLCNTMIRAVNANEQGDRNNPPTQKAEVDEPNIYQESFFVLAEALRTRHPGLLNTPLSAMSLDDFESWTEETYEMLSGVDNRRDFFFVVSSYLSRFKDGHSGIFYGPMEKKILPVSLTWIGEHLFISKAFDARFSHVIGKEIIKIGDYDTADFEVKINAYRQTDEKNLFHLRKEQFGSNFFLMLYDTYAYFDLLKDNSIVFTLKDAEGVENLSFPFIGMEGIAEEDFFVLARNPITRCTYKNGFTVVEDLSTLYFQMGMDELSSQMIEDIFRTIKKKGLKNLVLDLRNSGGGEAAEEAVEFFKYLVPKTGYYFGFTGWTREGVENVEVANNDGRIWIEQTVEDLRFDGRLIVFTNGTTFSSSAIFAMMVQDNDFGSIWGEPCGSNVFRFGKRTIVPLPQIDMAASFSSNIWDSANSENGNRFIQPDVMVYQTIDHYLTGEDALWDYYRGRINGQ